MLNSILPCNWEIFISPGNGCDREIHQAVGEMKHFVGEIQQTVWELKHFFGEMKQICWGNEAN